jgi:hypothetical protein
MHIFNVYTCRIYFIKLYIFFLINSFLLGEAPKTTLPLIYHHLMGEERPLLKKKKSVCHDSQLHIFDTDKKIKQNDNKIIKK